MTPQTSSQPFLKLPQTWLGTVLPVATPAETNVSLVLFSLTAGFHRRSCRVSLRRLAEKAGLSIASAREGAKRAVDRGTFSRIERIGRSSVFELQYPVREIAIAPPAVAKEKLRTPDRFHAPTPTRILEGHYIEKDTRELDNLETPSSVGE